MSQKEYIKIKLDLINKLAEYIISKPDLYKKYSDCSYVLKTSWFALYVGY